MIEYYKENIQLYILLFVWLAVGVYVPQASYIVVPLSMFLMYKKNMLEELFLGYLFILILSDSLEPSLVLAKEIVF